VNRVDRLLQQWRIRMALPWIPDDARLLDVGCFDDSLFRAVGRRLRLGIGLDPLLGATLDGDRYRLMPSRFPDGPVEVGPFDAITLLAVLEHAPEAALEQWARRCWALLVDGGVVVATVPSPRVDAVLLALRTLRIVDGMSLEEHHGFQPRQVPAVFEAVGFTLIRQTRFQLGLNNLFVLKKDGAPLSSGG
jgi:hypothetical protein